MSRSLLRERAWRIPGFLGLLAVLVATPPGAAAGTMDLTTSISMPLPSADIGDTELGIDVEIAGSKMQNRVFGIGLDLGYHYWPASADFKAGFDQQLRYTTGLVITDETWAFKAFHWGGHVKLVAPVSGPVVPWARVGLALYRVDRNLNFEDNVTLQGGHLGTAGIDFTPRNAMRVGIHASYYHVWSRTNLFADFTAYTAGVHLMFGWPEPTY